MTELSPGALRVRPCYSKTRSSFNATARMMGSWRRWRRWMDTNSGVCHEPPSLFAAGPPSSRPYRAFPWNGEKQDNYDIWIKVIGTEPPLRLTRTPDGRR
jgi:hypothetical protein